MESIECERRRLDSYRGSGETLTSIIYYPGVAERSKATAVEITTGQTQSSIELRVPTQKTYSVRGLISTNDKAGLTANSVHISLVNLDCPSIYTRYDQSVDFEGSFTFRRPSTSISKTSSQAATQPIFPSSAKGGSLERWN